MVRKLALVVRSRDRDDAVRPGASVALAGFSLTILLLVSMVGLNPLSAPSALSTTLSGEGDALRQIIYLATFGIAARAALLASASRSETRFPISFTFLLFWCGLSVLWAIEPLVAVRRLGLTTLITLTMLMVVSRLGADRAVSIFGKLCLVLLLASYVAVFVFPSGIHGRDEIDAALIGNWRGLFDHKNFTGPFCAVTVLTALFASRWTLFWKLVVAVAAGYFLFQTQSKSSLALLVPSVLYGVGLSLTSVRGRITLSFVILPILVGLVILFDPLAVIGQLTAEPDALTGRTLIWGILTSYFAENPFLGAGYGSFWNIGDLSPVYKLADSIWLREITSGHNGYLDMLVQIGLPGLLLTVVATMIIPLTVSIFDRRVPTHISAFCGSTLLFFVGHNFTESSVFDRDALMWILALFTIAVLYSSRRPAPPGAPASASKIGRLRTKKQAREWAVPHVTNRNLPQTPV